MFQNQNSANGNGGVLGGATANTMDPSMNYNGLQHQQPPQQQQQQHQQTQQQQHQHQQQEAKSTKNSRQKPYVKITEQPAGKALRFRYECEGRSAGSIPGVNSTPENKTYPTIEIVGYKGRAVVVVSCVTKDQPYRPHPHNLVGKEGCKKGVCTLEINSETMRAVFSNLGIQCVKKKDIEAALKAREEIRVDPFKTGFSHRYQPSSIDLNSVRLCFQVFMESDQKGRFTQPLPPVVSDPIFDKKAMSDLVICRLCSCSASVLGNTQIILLCEKVAKEDIAVRFFEEKNGQVVWEAYGEFQHTDVHKQTAITFKTPRYHTLDRTEPAKVFIQLKRPSDGVTSEKLPFEYKPLDSDPAHLRRKRQKTNGDPMHLLLQHQNDHPDGRQGSFASWNTPNIPPIKTEPRDTSPQPFGHYRAPPELTPSPQPLSPSNNYNHPNAPSPYNLAATGGGGGGAAALGNPQLISPNHHPNYGLTTATRTTSTVPGVNANNAGAPSPMDLQDAYANYGQQQQHQQQQQQQQQTHHAAAHNAQQQYHGNLFGGAGAAHWEGKFEVASLVNNNNANSNNNNQANNNMSNLNTNNPFTMHNLLNSSNNNANNAQAVVGGNGGQAAHLNWNLTANQMPQHHMQPTTLTQELAAAAQQHQQYQQHQVNNEHNVQQPNNIDAVGNDNTNNNNNANENAPTISNLLSFDSEQLVRINSEDLRLNSEDLQLSNLSIST